MEHKKCLIVDDDEMILTLVTAFLNTEGYCCTTAASGEDALNILNSNPFDLMICDITMYEINGIELTKKAKELYADMPVIIMTGFVDDFTYDEAIEAGASDFLKKPFTRKEVLTRIARVLRDVNIVASLKRKEKVIEKMGTEMISGLQTESQQKLKDLQDEVRMLKSQLES